MPQMPSTCLPAASVSAHHRDDKRAVAISSAAPAEVALNITTATTTSGVACRQDGWTAARQSTFFAAIADGLSVRDACALVGMSPSSAYAHKRRNANSAFSIGWDAASLFARDSLADMLYERATTGVAETRTARDGSEYTRLHYDNRLAMALLHRHDRIVDRCVNRRRGVSPALTVATNWDAFLALVDNAANPLEIAAFVRQHNPATAALD